MTQALTLGVEFLSLPQGDFARHAYAGDNGKSHHALVMGDIGDGRDVLTRVHSSCITGDVFGSLRCDCGDQLHKALSRIAAEGRGVLVYLDQEGRGIGLLNKLRAYQLQDQGADTVEANERLGFRADERDYGIAAAILVDLGVGQVRLMTNNPDKLAALVQGGIAIAGHVPLLGETNPHNRHYLDIKRVKSGHMLPVGPR